MIRRLIFPKQSSQSARLIEDARHAFSQVPQSSGFYNDSYGYALFPTMAKGGLRVGAARGRGRVYRQGKQVGDAALRQVSVGLQAGGQAYNVGFARPEGRTLAHS